MMDDIIFLKQNLWGIEEEQRRTTEASGPSPSEATRMKESGDSTVSEGRRGQSQVRCWS